MIFQLKSVVFENHKARLVTFMFRKSSGLSVTIYDGLDESYIYSVQRKSLRFLFLNGITRFRGMLSVYILQDSKDCLDGLSIDEYVGIPVYLGLMMSSLFLYDHSSQYIWLGDFDSKGNVLPFLPEYVRAIDLIPPQFVEGRSFIVSAGTRLFSHSFQEISDIYQISDLLKE